ncbi:MAG: hypothetical protein GQ565_03010 [Candidatus Aegiribacteria sp.]|nr:hypothetical protein [Candidatus Aegiribacteria sp.]
MNRRQNSAIDRSELARAAKPLGELIAGVARTRNSVGGSPPPVIVSNAPKKKRKKATAKKDRESTVLRDCLKYLQSEGIFVYRQNTGTLWANGQPVSFGYPGAGDITGILPGGKRLEIECKSAIGRQSKTQRAFQDKIEVNGGLYLLVRSVEELRAGLYTEGCVAGAI